MALNWNYLLTKVSISLHVACVLLITVIAAGLNYCFLKWIRHWNLQKTTKYTTTILSVVFSSPHGKQCSLKSWFGSPSFLIENETSTFSGNIHTEEPLVFACGPHSLLLVNLFWLNSGSFKAVNILTNLLFQNSLLLCVCFVWKHNIA